MAKDQDNGGEKVVQNPVQGIETSHLGPDIDAEDDRQADQHLHRPGALDEKHDPINDESHQPDIDRIKQPSEVLYEIEYPTHD